MMGPDPHYDPMMGPDPYHDPYQDPYHDPYNDPWIADPFAPDPNDPNAPEPAEIHTVQLDPGGNNPDLEFQNGVIDKFIGSGNDTVSFTGNAEPGDSFTYTGGNADLTLSDNSNAIGIFETPDIQNFGTLTVRGGAGADAIGYDGYMAYTLNGITMYGNGGNDMLVGNYGADTLYGGDGNDMIEGDGGNDELHGGAGADMITGDPGDDILYGDGGNDVLGGGIGNDELHGGAGDDIFTGGMGDDVLYGDDGNDVFEGGQGNDELHGGAGDDLMAGGLGDDILFGGADNDGFGLIHGLFGSDIIKSSTDAAGSGIGDDLLLLTGMGGFNSEAAYSLAHVNNGGSNDLVLYFDNNNQVVISDFFDEVGGDTAVETLVLDRNGDGLSSTGDIEIDLNQAAITALDDGGGNGQISLDLANVDDVMVA